MAGKRAYRLKRRADRMQQTHRRIVEAAVDLHSTIGPAQTTIELIAERAGVTRPTVYSHFPDQRTLFTACTGYGYETDPPPAAAPWRRVRDPEARLRGALADLYAYYRRHETLLANVVRDASLLPIVAEVSRPFLAGLAELRDTLAAGWGARGRRRARLLAVLGHALEFGTWHSLTARHGLTDEEAIEAMLALARDAANPHRLRADRPRTDAGQASSCRQRQ